MLITNTYKYTVLTSALNRIALKTHISITEEDASMFFFGDFGGKDNVIRFGLNWAALGTVSAGKAFEFTNDMMNALNIVNHLNALEIVVKYNTYGSSVMDDHRKYVLWMIDRLIHCDYDEIAEFLADTDM